MFTDLAFKAEAKETGGPTFAVMGCCVVQGVVTHCMNCLPYLHCTVAVVLIQLFGNKKLQTQKMALWLNMIMQRCKKLNFIFSSKVI